MTKESTTKQKSIFRGAVLAAAVLMLTALAFAGAGAASVTVVTTEAELQDALNLTSAEIQLGNNIDVTNCLVFGDGTTANTSTLDLNGYVLYQTTPDTRVLEIRKEASLKLTDSKPSSAGHIFAFNRTGAWDYKPAETSGIAIEAITDATADGTLISVPGGIITSVSRNPSDGDGGGAVVLNGSLEMDSGTIAGCACSLDASGSAKRGGAVLVDTDAESFGMKGTAQIIGCAANLGGAVLSRSASANSFVLTDNAKIRYCNSAKQGGAVQVNSGVFTLSGGEITHCTSAESGGGVHVAGGTFTMTGGEISYCSANKGGGVYIAKGTIFTLSGGEITHCSAIEIGANHGYGGGVLNYGTFTMTGGLISDCECSYKGGGVYLTSTGTFAMYSGEITHCTSAESGGGVQNNKGMFTMHSGKITYCSAKYGGGVCVPDISGTFIMSGGEITHCSGIDSGGQQGYGGGVMNAGTFTMYDGLISDCESSDCGGGVSNHGTFTIIYGGEITHCKAPAGGGVYNYDSAVMYMYSGRIAYCTAGSDDDSDGAGVKKQGELHISGTAVIENCHASSDGGGLSSMSRARLYIEGGTFRSNTAGRFGGGLDVMNGYTWISGGVFEKNTAPYGGGINVGYNKLTMKDGVFVPSPSNTWVQSSCIIVGGFFRDNNMNGNHNAISTLKRSSTQFPDLILGGTLTLDDDQTFMLIDLLKEPANPFWIGTPVKGVFAKSDIATNFTSEQFTGSIKNFIIENDDLDGRTVFEVKSGQTASDVLGRLGLKDTDKWTLIAGDASDPKKIVIQMNKPAASSVYFDWNSDGTAVNVSAALTCVNGAGAAKVLFYNATDYVYFTVTNTGNSAGLPTGGTQFIWKLTDNPAGAKDISTSLSPGETATYRLPVSKACFSVYDASGNLTYFAGPTAQQKAAASVNPENYADLAELNQLAVFTPLNTITGTAAGGPFAKGSIISDISVENLVPANPYTVKLVLENSDISDKNFGYDLGTVTCEAGLPTISQHPQSAFYQKDAAAAALQVTAAGTSLAYQWENSTDGKTFTEMTGETGSTFTPSTADAGTVYYRVNVTDTANSKSVCSLAAGIEVRSTYSITYNPAPGQNPAAGNPLQYASNEAAALNDPVRQYYVGYWKNAATNEPVSAIYRGTTGDLTLNGDYPLKEYYIIYEVGGVTTNPPSYNLTSGTIILTDAIRLGYKFYGWYANAAFTGAKVTSVSSAAPKDLSIYARWVPQVTKIVTAENNAVFLGDERIAVSKPSGAKTLFSEIDGLTPGKNITYVKDIPDLSTSDLPSESGSVTNLYSAFELIYDGTLSGEAQITLNVTLANGGSASNLHLLNNTGSGWTDISGLTMTQSGNIVTIVGNLTSFGQFAVVSYSAQQQYSSHSSGSGSSNDGYSIWLQDDQTGSGQQSTYEQAAEQLPEPTISPIKPTTTGKSPAPFLGILAGLGAAAVFFAMRRT